MQEVLELKVELQFVTMVRKTGESAEKQEEPGNGGIRNDGCIYPYH